MNNYTSTQFTIHDVSKLSHALETIQEWGHWDHVIPYIKFPQAWSVKARPNFCGSIIRYDIREDNSGNTISVFLDCYDIFGFVRQPYWEIYPDKDGDYTRILMANIDELIETIQESFTNWKNDD